MRRLGQWALARHLDIEIPFGPHGAKSDHAHPGTGDDRRTEVTVKLDDLGQPFGIGGLPVVIGGGQAIFGNGQRRQDEEKNDGNEPFHGRGSELDGYRLALYRFKVRCACPWWCASCHARTKKTSRIVSLRSRRASGISFEAVVAERAKRGQQVLAGSLQHVTDRGDRGRVIVRRAAAAKARPSSFQCGSSWEASRSVAKISSVMATCVNCQPMCARSVLASRPG